MSTYQSGFLPGRSTTTQLLEVFNCFCKAIDSNKEVRVVFLDISKAFDKVWHKGLLYKLKKCGIGGSLLAWFKDYLHERQQRVLINGQSSSWESLTAGVPQRVESASLINRDLISISDWAKRWLITFSPSKTKSLTISNKNDRHDNPTLFLNNLPIEEVSSHTYLGLTFSNNLRWNKHIDNITTKAHKRLNMMLPLKFKVDRASLETMYKSFVLPILEYSNIVWGGVYDCDKVKIEQIQIYALRLITGATAKSNISQLYIESGWLTTQQRLDNAKLTMIFKIKNSLAPSYLTELLPPEVQARTTYNLRNNRNIQIPLSRLEVFKRSFFPSAITLWNNLSNQVRNSVSIQEFKRVLKNQSDKQILYYYGERWACIHHARLRMGCSMLNSDLCFNLHVVDDPSCRCGCPIENASHFFLDCNQYRDIRTNLMNTISGLTSFSLKHILYGDRDLILTQNQLIFGAVHTFLTNSQRFK